MAMDEVLAAILGGLEGGIGGWQAGRKMQQDERDRQAQRERQKQEDAWRAEQRRLQLEDRARMERDRLRTDTEGLLTSLGRDAVLTPEQTAQVGQVGLGHRVRPEETLTSSFFSGYTAPTSEGLAGGETARVQSPGRATGRAFVAPTPEERQADASRAQLQQRLARTREAIAATGNAAALQAFDANPEAWIAKPSEESFVSVPAKLARQRAEEDAKIEAKVKEGHALLPVKLREKEEGEKIEARYRPKSEGLGPTKIVQGTDDEGRPVSYLIDREGNIVKTFGRPVSSADQRAATEADVSAQAVQSIRDLYKPDYVGPVQGRLSKLSTATGFKLTPEKAKFAAAVAHMKNEIIRDITGAAVGVQEEGRIMGEIPDMNDPPDTFLAKLEQTEKNRQFLRDRAATRAGGRRAPADAPGAGTVPPPPGSKNADPLGIR